VVLEEATGVTSDAATGEVEADVVSEMLSDREDEEELALFRGGASCTRLRDDAGAGVRAGVEEDGAVMICKPLGTTLLVVSGGCC